MKDYTMARFKKTVPAGGLLNPKLRIINTNVKGIRPMGKPKCGRFGNVGVR